MSGSGFSNKVLVATLWQRTSDKGNEYLSGFLEGSRHRLSWRLRSLGRRTGPPAVLPRPRRRHWEVAMTAGALFPSRIGDGALVDGMQHSE